MPPGYDRHFQSFDGKARKLVVEGVGGPSWFTEYNVLTGLSARSYGRFATSVTRIAAGRVSRGLPHSLSRCGYKTFSLYPFYGAFLGSRAFQVTTGIARYLDMLDLGTRDFEADSFYFDRAVDIIERERGNGPLFLYVYTVANHFPWDTRLRPELTPDWRDLGNAPDIDEYIRRQGMTAHDYRRLLERLAREFPAESFLIVRYGDHQPQFGARIIDPSLGKEALARRLEASDRRYLTTYYAIDTVNFTPADLSSALDTLDAPYLPLVDSGGGRRAAGSELFGAEEDPATLRWPVLRLRRWRRGAPFQPAPDRGGLDQGAIGARGLRSSHHCGWRSRLRHPQLLKPARQDLAMIVIVIVAVVVMIEDIMIVIVRPDSSLARRHRIGGRRGVVCGRCGDARRDTGLQQPVDDILGVVADQETIPHQFVDRQHHLRFIEGEGRVTLLNRGTRILRRRTGGRPLPRTGCTGR